MSESISFMKRNDLSFCDEYIEFVSIEFEKQVFSSSKGVIVSVQYRPPNTDVNLFIEKVNLLMQMIAKDRKLC